MESNITSYLKSSAWTSVAESILLLVLGIFLVTNPTLSLIIISYIISAFLALRGLYEIINYFITKGYKNFFNNSLLTGIVSLLAGIIIFLASDSLFTFYRIALGIIVIYLAIVKINLSIKLSAAKAKLWYLPLILSIISLFLGGFLILNESSTAILAGWFFIITSIFSLIGDILFIQELNSLASFFSKSKS